MLPANARQAHQEMADIPLLDKGAYVLLGNDDLFLQLVQEGAGPDAIRDYVAWTLRRPRRWRSRSSIPAGSAPSSSTAASSTSTRPGPFYGITPRTILTTLADAVTELGVPHPIHVHGCNLGVAGADATTLATIAGMEGRRIHLTHLQFHSYGKDGQADSPPVRRRSPSWSTAAPNVSCRRRPGHVRPDRDRVRRHDEPGPQRPLRPAEEVGRHGHRVRCRLRRPAIPLPRPELGQRAAMVRRPRAVPAGRGPLARLPDHRPPQRRALHHLPAPDPAADGPQLPRATCWPRSTRVRAPLSALDGIDREYTLHEIAIVTRAGPARILGIQGRMAISAPAPWPTSPSTRTMPDRERMFSQPALLLKAGRP